MMRTGTNRPTRRKERASCFRLRTLPFQITDRPRRNEDGGTMDVDSQNEGGAASLDACSKGLNDSWFESKAWLDTKD